MKSLFYLFFLVALFGSCSSKTLTSIIVASEYGAFCDGEGNVLQKSYIVKTNSNGNWYLLPFLDGFPYEPGYEYVINVSGNYQEEGYEFEDIVKKQKKSSEGIPSLLLWDNSWKEPVSCDLLNDRYLNQ